MMDFTDIIFPIVVVFVALLFIFLFYELCTCIFCKSSDDDENSEVAILTERTQEASSSRPSGRRSWIGRKQSNYPASQTGPVPGKTQIIMPMLAQNSMGQIVLIHQVDGVDNYRILEEYHAANGNAIYRTTPNQNQQLVAAHQSLFTWPSQAALASGCSPAYPQMNSTPTPSAPPPPYRE